MTDKLIDELKSTRDFLFDLYDQEDREELKLALRLVNREIRRLGAGAPAPEARSSAGPPAWTEGDDDYLRSRLAGPTQSKDEAKRILVECSQHLGRTDAETYSRIRALHLHANLHAWGSKPKIQWRTMHSSSDEPSLPGVLQDAYGGRDN